MVQHAQVVLVDVGSTTTLVSGYHGLDGGQPFLLGQGMAPTSVLEGDVTVGLQAAVADLARRLGGSNLTWDQMLATSSAAGGLKMTVHGLAYDMTAKAAREAALGAGAVVRLVTAGMLGTEQVAEVQAIAPNIVLLAGGVDYGEQATVWHNARMLAPWLTKDRSVPVIFAGNVAAQAGVCSFLQDQGIEVYPVDNVYPRIDQLHIEPTRQAIQEVFAGHITRAPGMEHIRQMVTGAIRPTPGAVMDAARLLYAEIGDLMVVDVGGATTDVHSVTEGSEEITRHLVAPEPIAKRTVEGDLGVYLNALNLVERIGREKLVKELGQEVEPIMGSVPAVPANDIQERLLTRLCQEAVEAAIDRHAGYTRHLYGSGGRTMIAEGKDLTQVRWIIGTGGALTRLPGGAQILAGIKAQIGDRRLLPSPDTQVKLDRHYVMAAAGLLSSSHRDAALQLLVASLGLTPAPVRR